ncbi:hypothetical protein MTO96_026897 [Rhipicephalus appendiculatus]
MARFFVVCLLSVSLACTVKGSILTSSGSLGQSAHQRSGSSSSALLGNESRIVGTAKSAAASPSVAFPIVDAT